MRMKNLAFLFWSRVGMATIFLVLLHGPSHAQHETQADWVFLLDGYNDTDLADLEVDAEGNIYFTVNYLDRLSIPELDKELPPSRYVGTAIGKLDKTGKPLWVHAIESAKDCRSRDMTIAPDGDILITGFCDGISRFPSGSDTIICGRKKRENEYYQPHYAFVAKYSPEGKCKWARVLSAPWAEGQGVAANSKGEIFLTVQYKGTLRNGGTILDSLGGVQHNWERNAVLKLSNKGELLNFFPLKLLSHFDGQHFSFTPVTDAQDQLYIYGTFRGRIDFTPTDSLANEGSNDGPDAFIAKYDPDGKFLWCRKIGGQGYQSISDICVNEAGQITLTGQYSYECIVSQGLDLRQRSKYEWKSGLSFFYCALEPDGSLRFAKYHQQKGYNSSCIGYSLDLDVKGYMHLTGSFTDTLDFGTALSPIFAKECCGFGFYSLWAGDSLISLLRDIDGEGGMSNAIRIRASQMQMVQGGIYYGNQQLKMANGGKTDFSKRDYGRSSFIYGKKIPPLPPIQKPLDAHPANHLIPLDPQLVCMATGEHRDETFWFPEDEEEESEPGSPHSVAFAENPCGVNIESWQANLFPNPASAQTTLQLKGLAGSCKVEIITANGVLIYSQQVQVPNEEYVIDLNLQPLALGVYFVTVSHEGFIKVLRLVKGE